MKMPPELAQLCQPILARLKDRMDLQHRLEVIASDEEALHKLLVEAKHAMTGILVVLGDKIRERFHRPISNEAYALLQAMPLVKSNPLCDPDPEATMQAYTHLVMESLNEGFAQ